MIEMKDKTVPSIPVPPSTTQASDTGMAFVAGSADPYAKKKKGKGRAMRNRLLESDDEKESGNVPPWVIAEPRHTTSGAGENAEIHVVRAVSTGIINVCRLTCKLGLYAYDAVQLSLSVQESEEKLKREVLPSSLASQLP